MRNFIIACGTVASLLGFVLQATGVSGPPGWNSAVYLLGAALLLAALSYDPFKRRFRLVVKAACKNVKRDAYSSIDIAAGDCSWLPSEIDLIQEKLNNGVHIRLLCERPANETYTNMVTKLAEHRGVEVRLYPESFRAYLRCIIADATRQHGGAMLVLDKDVSPEQMFALLPRPNWLRRNHTATFVPSHTRLFGLVCETFEQTFKAGAPWDGDNGNEPS